MYIHTQISIRSFILSYQNYIITKMSTHLTLKNCPHITYTSNKKIFLI